MYKQQKPLSLSSSLWAGCITALVLVIASAANAQDTSTSSDATQPIIKRDAVEAPRAARAADAESRQAELDAKVAERKSAMEASRLEREEKMAARKTEMETKRAEWETKITDRKATIEQKRQEMASSTAARKAALEERVQKKIEQAGARVTEALNRAIVKIGELNARLQARADGLADRGVDTSEVNALLEETDSTLEAAKAALAGIDVNVEYAATSDDPRTDWQDTKAQFQEVRELIRTAHSLLREALAALKTAVSESNLERGVSEATRQNNTGSTSP